MITLKRWNAEDPPGPIWCFPDGMKESPKGEFVRLTDIQKILEDIINTDGDELSDGECIDKIINQFELIII